ncbi:imelysin family protein [Pseudopelagicola sp. nBUS_19]|uniref:imelysin family protein n=1 Tax=Pseudopelagicola sp. nBUS_19 TaxID=3395316 RepID=UPI003EBA0A6C
MRRIALILCMMTAPKAATADTIQDIVDGHILPRFEALATQTYALSDVAIMDCDPTSDALRSAYGDAFDAWISASHLRFGPTEVDDRAYALAFWPDSRGATPRALNALLADQDPIAASVETYGDVSIAARGFYAMEFLLYDETLIAVGEQKFHCQLVQTISADIALTTSNILEDWLSDYSGKLSEPAPDGIYRSDEEVLQEIFKSLSTGLQFTSETRLGRPLGTFDRPRPTRSEARRSERSASHVMLSLAALQDLAARLAGDDENMATTLDASFDRAMSQLDDLDDPTFAGVADPQTRLKIEVLQQSIDTIRAVVRDELGPTLGVAAGFNSLDGD